jgi:hypothetical protein
MKTPEIKASVVKEAPFITCDCGGKMFTEAVMFKKISMFVSPTGKEEILPISVILCKKCGLVPSAFNTDRMIPEEYIAFADLPIDLKFKITKRDEQKIIPDAE